MQSFPLPTQSFGFSLVPHDHLKVQQSLMHQQNPPTTCQVEEDEQMVSSLQLLKGHEMACLSWSLASLHPNHQQLRRLRAAVQQHVARPKRGWNDQRGLAMLARSLVKLQLGVAFQTLVDEVGHQDLAPATGRKRMDAGGLVKLILILGCDCNVLIRA